MAEAHLTLGEAEKLFEEKVERLRGEARQANVQVQGAVQERDRAQQDVAVLRREKDQLIEQIATAKQEAERIKQALAQHRKQVEESLAKQETQANEAINRAASVQATLQENARRINQLRSQVVGIKTTVRDNLLASLQTLSRLIEKTTEQLAAIPDGQDISLTEINKSGKS